MNDNKTITKIVGSTFHPLPEGKFVKIHGEVFEYNGVPAILTRAVLMPEPNNAYDPDAVKVLIELSSGESFHIGYIGKDSPIKLQITDTQVGIVRIVDYTDTGGQPSYQLIHLPL